MPKFIDLTGEEFGKLTVRYRMITDSKHTFWFCECDCGGKKEARSDALRNGTTTHCGCVGLGTHNKTGHRLFNIWQGMKERCYNTNSKDYNRYGGRGIEICQEWLDDFMNFYNWAMENGYDYSLSIDRTNVNRNYEPNNCKWATPEEQANNTRNNNLIEVNGEVKSVSQWARISGVSRYVIKKRYAEGVRGSDLFFPVEEIKAQYQSGVPYIKWDKKKERWRTEVKYNGKKYFVGNIKDLDDAINKQNEFKERLIKQREEVEVE